MIRKIVVFKYHKIYEQYGGVTDKSILEFPALWKLLVSLSWKRAIKSFDDLIALNNLIMCQFNSRAGQICF